MFTDIVGFSAMMATDENKTIALLNKQRKLLTYWVGKYRGELIKEMGDGTLSLFESVAEAVYCAVNIQQQLQHDKTLILRIGLNIGDSARSATEVVGNAVNIASRLESIAPAGTVCVSDMVYNAVANLPEIEARYIGKKKLKNIERALKVYLLSFKQKPQNDPIKEKTKLHYWRVAKYLSIGLFFLVTAVITLLANYKSPLIWPIKTIASSSSSSAQKTTLKIKEKSIAVLPFSNLSGDSNYEYFSDGLSEELLNKLAKISLFKVAARTSSFAFKGKNENIKIIGKKLGVTHILEGSVRKSLARVRINAQLIDVANGFQLWSGSYDRKLKGIFVIQDEISQAVVASLKRVLLGKHKTPGQSEQSKQIAAIQPTQNLQAFDYYLIGKHHLNLRTVAELKISISSFERAIELDPHYAEAYANLALANLFLNQYGGLSFKQAAQSAQAALQQAQNLKPDLSVLPTISGLIKLDQDDLKGAAEDLKQAIALNANSAMAHMWYGNLLYQQGNYQAAKQPYTQAMSLDPLSPIVNLNYAANLYQLGKFKQAQAHYLKIIDMAPAYPGAYRELASIKWERGQIAAAIEWYQQAHALDKHNPGTLAALGGLYLQLNQIEPAKHWIEKAWVLGPLQPDVMAAKMLLYSANGQYSALIALFEKQLRLEPASQDILLVLGEAQLLQGHFRQAQHYFEKAYPDLFEAQFQWDWDTLTHSLNISQAIYMLGYEARAKKLLLACQSYMDFLWGQGIMTSGDYYLNARLYALMGQESQALTLLSKAIKAGWRGAWLAEREPNLISLRSLPQFKHLMTKVKRLIDREVMQLKQANG